MYCKLKETYFRESRGNLTKALYFVLLDLQSTNKRMRMLIPSAIPAEVIPRENLESMLQKLQVQYIDSKKNIVLTSLGIWFVENELKCISHEKLLHFIEQKWFDCFKHMNQALTEKEKVLLLSTLAVRTFSATSAVDLNKDERFHLSWRDAVEKVASFLIENTIITDKDVSRELFGGQGQKTSLRPVVHCFRYSADIPKKTNGIYIAKNLKYFLNITDENVLNTEKLSYLFELVFERRLDFELMGKTYRFICELAYEKSAEVFTVDQHMYTNPEIDDIIEKTLRKLVLKQ